MVQLHLALAKAATINPELANGLSLNPAEVFQSALLWVQSLGYIGAIAFILIYIVATVTLIPGSLLTLGAGAIFGITWGSVYVFAGAILGETCAFLLGRYFARDWVITKIAQNETFAALDKALNQEGLKIILLTRLSPIFPFGLLNYAFGVTGISLKDYFLGSIGMIPMTIAYVYFGSLAGDLAKIGEATELANPELQWAIRIVGLIATIAATFYITRVARQALDKSLARV